MARIHIEMKAVIEYELDPEKREETPLEAVAHIVEYAQGSPMDYLDFTEPKWTVTGNVVEP